MGENTAGKKILTAVVVNDDATQLNILTSLLHKERLDAKGYQGAEEALLKMSTDHPPDLIVTDLYMPDIDGWQFCRLLRSTEYQAFNRVPILLVSATFGGDEASNITAELGANAFLPSPVDGREFINTVRAIYAGRKPKKTLRVLIVEDSRTLAGLLARYFKKNSYRVDIANTGKEALKCFAMGQYDIALLDYHLPDIFGDTLLKKFQIQNSACVCIMMTSDSNPKLALEFMKAGAAAYLRKPFDPEYLVEQCSRVRRERVLLRVEDLLEERTRELLKSKEKYQNIFENLPIGLYQTTLNGRIITANPACMSISGCPEGKKEQWLSQNTLDSYCYPEQGKRFRKLLLECGEVKAFETVLKGWDGKNRWLSLNANLLEDDQGQKNIISGSLIDITDLKIAEKKLQKTREFLESAIFQSPSGILIADAPSMKIRYANQAASDILGYGSKDLEGLDGTKNSIEWTAVRLNGMEYNAEEMPLARALLNGEVTKNEEILIHDCKGNKKWIKANASPIYNPNGQILAGIVIFQDTTEYKQIETEKQQLELRMVEIQKMESIGNLAAGIAHDINNILFPILGRSELLLDDLVKGGPEYNHAEQIQQAAIRGRDIVRQILTFGRKTEHKMVPIRIQHILKEVLELSRSAIPSTIEIHQKIQSKCGPVLADPTQIHQVMMNIITNAYHAIDKDGGQIRIELKEAELSNDQSFDLGIKVGRYIKLNISDTGPGIPDTLANKIFDPYFTTKGEGQGTGLGLAVVHGIIKEHQGAIRVTSEPGKGAIFNIFLPLIKESTNSVQPKEDNGNFQTGEEKILVVDDEPSIAMLEKQMLERLGYKVSSFHNSIEALNMFKAKPEFFDLVISDMSMPEFSGIRLAKKLRKIRPDIPIIICSGLSCEMNTQHIESIKINGFLVKPVTRTELAKTIRAVLGQIENQKRIF